MTAGSPPSKAVRGLERADRSSILRVLGSHLGQLLTARCCRSWCTIRCPLSLASSGEGRCSSSREALCWRASLDTGRLAKLGQVARNAFSACDHCEQPHAPVAVGARQNVDGKCACKNLRPRVVGARSSLGFVSGRTCARRGQQGPRGVRLRALWDRRDGNVRNLTSRIGERLVQTAVAMRCARFERASLWE